LGSIAWWTVAYILALLDSEKQSRAAYEVINLETIDKWRTISDRIHPANFNTIKIGDYHKLKRTFEAYFQMKYTRCLNEQ
jgi:hypothetical protein